MTSKTDKAKSLQGRSVGIVDDREVVRLGVRALMLECFDCQVQWAVDRIDTAVRRVERVDLLMMRVDLPGSSLAASVRRLRRGHPTASIAGMVDDVERFSTRDGDVSLFDLVVPLMAPRSAWMDGFASVSGTTLAGGSVAVDEVGLTARELEVLTLLGSARANRSIALSLGIAETTVKRHVSSIFVKLKSTSRLEAALTARRAGLISG